MAGIGSIINSSFLQRFQKLASSNSNTIAFNGSRPSATDGLSAGLRLGARTFANAVQNINSAISIVNLSKDTLSKLSTVTGQMIALAEESASRNTSKAQRYDLSVRFQALAGKFRGIVDESEIGDVNYLTTDGLEQVLQQVGLNTESASSLANVLSKFVTASGDRGLASEYIKGSRPSGSSPTAYTTNASDSAYKLTKLTNDPSNILTGGAGISTVNSVYAATDDVLNQNPTSSPSLFTVDSVGSTFSIEAGGITSSVQLIALNETTGNAVVLSSSDPLGFNTDGYLQLFLMGTDGQFLGQLTNFTAGAYPGGINIHGADISADNDKVLVQFEDRALPAATSLSIELIDITTIGANPSGFTHYTVASGLANLTIEDLKINNAGTYAGYIDTTTAQVNLFSISGGTFTFDGSIGALSAGATDFGFVDDDSIAFQETTGDVEIKGYRYGAGIAPVLIDPVSAVEDFTTLQAVGEAFGRIAFVTPGASKTIELYKSNGDFVTSYGDGSNITLVSGLSLAYKAGGGTDVDIGIVGILQGDPDIEFYRLTTNPLYNTGQQSTKSTIDYDQLFDSDQTINTRPDAERVLSDLKALKDQIDSNTEVLDSLKEALQENVELVRAAGKAFLNIADQLNSRDNAQTLAEKIRQAIRRNSYGALSQADNLNSIVVAALTSD